MQHPYRRGEAILLCSNLKQSLDVGKFPLFVSNIFPVCMMLQRLVGMGCECFCMRMPFSHLPTVYSDNF